VIVLCVLLVLSLGISEYMVRTNAIDAFYLLHSRGWELALGGLIGLGAIPPLRKQWGIEIAAMLGCILLILSVLFYH
jgi:peptidoglycan/LPS O-acetylase OafA/YrhL